ncbi:MAG: MBL fold metallo-hydrolase [Spirochaetaceae bacterium]|jgi:glyoxylase-like metal-dependent hydrolase (beta-lactamase superfamily II)|nr:MBL fold metallo-hydrolase [Spirochaetaceae bacterium]
MKLSFNYCKQSLSNCYLLGADCTGSENKTETRDALIIDPGCMDESILDFIESNNYTLKGILLTHNHASHIAGLRSLKRIYSAGIYASNSLVMNYKTNVVQDGDTINIGTFNVKIISAPGHSIDSMVYLIDHLLFTGDVLSAGLTGRTDSAYSAMRQIAMIQNKIFTLRGNYIVLPGHGPPTTLNVERAYNIGVGLFEENRNRTHNTSFSLDLLDNSNT